MMCCADASEKCPVVFGSETICLLHYEDPKVADNTSGEAAKYDERSLQIGREMFYVMSEVAKNQGSCASCYKIAFGGKGWKWYLAFPLDSRRIAFSKVN